MAGGSVRDMTTVGRPRRGRGILYMVVVSSLALEMLIQGPFGELRNAVGGCAELLSVVQAREPRA